MHQNKHSRSTSECVLSHLPQHPTFIQQTKSQTRPDLQTTTSSLAVPEKHNDEHLTWHQEILSNMETGNIFQTQHDPRMEMFLICKKLTADLLPFFTQWPGKALQKPQATTKTLGHRRGRSCCTNTSFDAGQVGDKSIGILRTVRSIDDVRFCGVACFDAFCHAATIPQQSQSTLTQLAQIEEIRIPAAGLYRMDNDHAEMMVDVMLGTWLETLNGDLGKHGSNTWAARYAAQDEKSRGNWSAKIQIEDGLNDDDDVSATRDVGDNVVVVLRREQNWFPRGQGSSWIVLFCLLQLLVWFMLVLRWRAGDAGFTLAGSAEQVSEGGLLGFIFV